MMQYVSTRGQSPPVDFEAAVTSGFAADGGLFVPEQIPSLPQGALEKWAGLGFVDLAFEVLSRFIDRDIVPETDLRRLLASSFGGFAHAEITPVRPLSSRPGLYVQELYHGPTLSFKDVAMGFLVNTLDYFCHKNGRRLSLLVATTGDTGPAAAHACRGKAALDCWVLFPAGFISDEQERQVTTIEDPGIHGVSVENCPSGGDDLDVVVARLFADKDFSRRTGLSSVNSINWGRVLVQTVHFFYGYFRAAKRIGDPVSFSVPTGAFGDLFGGYLARSMGLPVEKFIAANNKNAALHRLLTKGVLEKRELCQTVSSAIDIVVPYNVWRFLYCTTDGDYERVRRWMEDFEKTGRARVDEETLDHLRQWCASAAVSDEQTLDLIARTSREEDGYLIDPHTAVALGAAEASTGQADQGTPVIVLSTAHPAKFPDVVRRAFRTDDLPEAARHPSIEDARTHCRRLRTCDHQYLEPALRRSMLAVAGQRSK